VSVVSLALESELSMPLIECPACGRQISVEAEACPQCGHPNRPRASAAAEPKCYACQAPATTRCQCCGILSCVRHLESIYVPHGEGGAYELRCESCYSSAETRKAIGRVIAVVVVLVILMIFIAFVTR
jgi:hypothetical protein